MPEDEPVPATPGPPPPAAPTTYVILSHGRIPQLLRLLRTLRAGSPHAHLVVHHDGHVVPLDPAEARAAGADHVVVAPGPIAWGDMTVVDAVIRSLRWVHEHLDDGWVVLLSGQDYPVRPLADLEQRLATGPADAYIRHDRVGTDREIGRWTADTMARRYFFHYRPVPGGAAMGSLLARLSARVKQPPPDPASGAADAPGPSGPAPAGSAPAPNPGLLRRLRSVPVHLVVLPRGLGLRVGWRARDTPFGPGYPCWKGAMWAMLSARAVETVLTEVDRRPDLLDHYRQTMIPDESVLATILANAPGLRLDGEPLRYTVWSGGSPHPRTLTAGDLPAIEASGAFLARKFDAEQHPEVLDVLDGRLGSRPT